MKIGEILKRTLFFVGGIILIKDWKIIIGVLMLVWVNNLAYDIGKKKE